MAIAAVAVVKPADLLDAATGAGAVIALAMRLQPGQRLAIGVMTLRLPQDVAVPVQAVVLQLMQNARGGAGNFARRIDIFNAHQPAAVLRARAQIAAKGGNQRAEMEVAGRRRGETPDAGMRRHWL